MRGEKHDRNCDMTETKTAHINACGRWYIWPRWAFCSGWDTPCQPAAGGSGPGLTHYLGKGALHLLLLTLLVSPLAKRWRRGQLVAAPPSAPGAPPGPSLHFMVWLGLDLQFDWGLIGGELVKAQLYRGGDGGAAVAAGPQHPQIPACCGAWGRPGRTAQLDLRGGLLCRCTTGGRSRAAGRSPPHLSAAGLRLCCGRAGTSCCPLASGKKGEGAAQQPSRAHSKRGPLAFCDLAGVGRRPATGRADRRHSRVSTSNLSLPAPLPNVVITLSQQQLDPVRPCRDGLGRPAKTVEKSTRISRILRGIIFIPDSWLAHYKRHYVRF